MWGSNALIVGATAIAVVRPAVAMAAISDAVTSGTTSH